VVHQAVFSDDSIGTAPTFPLASSIFR